MKWILCGIGFLSAIGIIGCNPSDGSSGGAMKATDYSYQGLGPHDSAGCPSLRGIYLPEDRMGTQFQFTERGGYLVLSTRAAGQTNFNEIIVVSGVTFTYGNGDTAAAKCVSGQIVMQNTTAAGGRVQVNLEPTAQGFTRAVWRPRNPPVVTHFHQQ